VSRSRKRNAGPRPDRKTEAQYGSADAFPPAAQSPLPPLTPPPLPSAVAADERRVLSLHPDAPDREVMWWLLLGFFALFVIGFYLLRIPGSAEGNPLGFDRAMFAATAAVTLTGLRQDVGASPFAAADATLIPSTLLMLTVGGAYLTLLATALPACRVLGMPHRAGRIAAAAGILVGGGTLLGGAIVLVASGAQQTPGGPNPILDAFLKAASAVANSGVSWGPAPRVDAKTTHLVLLPLAVAGGLGLPVLLDLYDRVFGRTPALSFHTKLVLTLTAAAYVVGVLALLAFNDDFVAAVRAGLRPRDGGWTPSQGRAIRDMLVSASTLCIESRSAGFANVPLATLPRAANWVLVLLMAVGASPAGTAGGLKTTTLYLLYRAVRQGARGERPPAVTGFAVVWLAWFAGIVFVGFAVLLAAAPEVPTERLLTVAVSATANCGLAHDALSVVRGPLMALVLMMAMGRVVPILLLWRTAERIEFAETVPG
jgi:trk system potassium uptake protein TrkH